MTEEEKLLVKLRYGKDLDNPVSVKLSMEQLYTFYNSLIPKMRRLLLKLDKGIHLLSVPSENSQKYLRKILIHPGYLKKSVNNIMYF